LIWVVRVKDSRTQRGFGRAAGIVEKSAGQWLHPSAADQAGPSEGFGAAAGARSIRQPP